MKKEKITLILITLICLTKSYSQIEINCDLIEDFNKEGYALIFRNKTKHYINTKGKEFTESEFLKNINATKDSLYITNLKYSYTNELDEREFNTIIDANGKTIFNEKNYVIRNFNNVLRAYNGEFDNDNVNFVYKFFDSKGNKISHDYKLKRYEEITPISKELYLHTFKPKSSFSSLNDKPFAYLKSFKNDSILHKNIGYVNFFKNKTSKLSKLIDGKLKWGFINEQGKLIVDFKFTKEPGNFSENYAVVITQDNKCGYIDKTGKLVIPPTYEYASEFHNGIALVKITSKFENNKMDNGFLLIDKNNKIIHRFKELNVLRKIINYKRFNKYILEENHIVRLRNSSSYYLFNTINKELISVDYKSMGEFNSGYSKVSSGFSTKRIEGFCNSKGELSLIKKKINTPKF